MTTKPHDDHAHNTHTHNQRANVAQWWCPNCGQHIFVVRGIEPPDTCEYCKDMTTWQLVEK